MYFFFILDFWCFFFIIVPYRRVILLCIRNIVSSPHTQKTPFTRAERENNKNSFFMPSILHFPRNKNNSSSSSDGTLKTKQAKSPRLRVSSAIHIYIYFFMKEYEQIYHICDTGRTAIISKLEIQHMAGVFVQRFIWFCSNRSTNICCVFSLLLFLCSTVFCLSIWLVVFDLEMNFRLQRVDFHSWNFNEFI